MTWQARVVDDFPMNGARIHLAERVGDSRNFVVQLGPGRDTIVRTVPSRDQGPDGLLVPADAIEPLRDALDKYLGRPRDDYRAKYEEARDALEVERRRVDALLDRLGATS